MGEVSMPRDVCILTPVYNDWDSLRTLLGALDSMAARHDLRLRVLAVDDGSTQPPPAWELAGLRHIARFEVLALIRNLGHQRAIAMGLAVLTAQQVGLPVVVMDADGEDQPGDIPRLLAAHDQHPGEIIFAQRAKRSEGRIFRLFYALFKLMFGLLVGRQISFGNFCLIPAGLVQRAAYLQEIWNHFAAGVMHAGLRWRTVPTERGRRYAGNSHMNLLALVLHGLSAISVYIEVVYVRLLFFAFALIGLDVLAFLALVYIRFGTPLAIPGWATSVAVGLTVVMVQALLFLALLSFVVLSYRSAKMFIPAVDYRDYLLKIEQVGP